MNDPTVRKWELAGAPTNFRHRGTRMYGVVVIVALFAMLVMGVTGYLEGALELRWFLVFAPFAAGYGYVAWRALRLGYDVRGNRLVVHSLVRRIELAREDVQALNFTTPREGAGRRILRVVPRSGDRVRIWSVGFRWEGSTADSARRHQQRLQEWVAGAR